MTPGAPKPAEIRNGWLCRALTLVFGILALTQGAYAASQQIEFDIPAQPLESALSSYGATTRIQLFFDARLTDGRRSEALKGIFTPETALKALLAGSGLAARAIDDRGFTLVAQPWPSGRRADSWDVVSPMVMKFSGYSAAIQGAVGELLCRRQETIAGPFRALVRLWMNASGIVARSELLTSTGDETRDAMLSAELQDLAIGTAPPAALPQPITLLLTSEGRAAGHCPENRSTPRRADGGRESFR